MKQNEDDKIYESVLEKYGMSLYEIVFFFAFILGVLYYMKNLPMLFGSPDLMAFLDTLFFLVIMILVLIASGLFSANIKLRQKMKTYKEEIKEDKLEKYTRKEKIILGIAYSIILVGGLIAQPYITSFVTWILDKFLGIP